MLPIFEAKKAAGTIIARRGKTDTEATPEVEAPGSEIDPALKSAAEAILSAIEHKSVIDLARSIEDAFDAIRSGPDEEPEDFEEEGE